MKRFIIFVFLFFMAAYAWADSVGVKVTPNGVKFPLGIDYANTPNWDTAVSIVNEDTGIDSHGVGDTSCEAVIRPSDKTKIDIAQCNVHIQGPRYTFAPITAFDPQFATGQNSRFVGATMNGYTTQTSKWTSEQKRTIIPIARLNTPLGQLGPGSTIGLIRDDRYYLFERDTWDRLYREEAVGALYVKGGNIFATATSLVLGQYSGVLYDAQTKRHVLTQFQNTTAIFLNHTATGGWVAKKQLFRSDNVYFDNGTRLVPMQNDNKYSAATIMKSPKGQNGTQEGGIFYVYSQGEYDTIDEALAATPSYSVFGSQSESGLVPAALIVQKKSAVAPAVVVDKRPCFVCR